MVVTREWQVEQMGSCLIGIEFQFYKIKNSEDVLQNNVKMVNTNELCILKMAKLVNFATLKKINFLSFLFPIHCCIQKQCNEND